MGESFTGREISLAYSRMQHCITLSSCESEVIAVCQISQECIGLRHLTEFLENFADPAELENFTRLTSPRLSSTAEQWDSGKLSDCCFLGFAELFGRPSEPGSFKTSATHVTCYMFCSVAH